MMKQEMSVREKRKQKFLLVLPLLLLPFVTLAFYAMGGGRSSEKPAAAKEGLNEQLPQPVETSATEDKMSFYDQADKDSMAAAEMMRSDPYYKNHLEPDPSGGYTDPNEARVMEKIKAISEVVSAPSVRSSSSSAGGSSAFSKEVARSNNVVADEPDPEMTAINQTIEKILDVQHPERVSEKIRENSLRTKGQVFKVSTASGGNGFFGLNDEDSSIVVAIPAVVHAEQNLVSGATVKMRLLSDVYVRGVMIPKGSFVFGVASLNGERLRIGVDNIAYKEDLYPVSLSVYDADGIAGIKVPGSINRETAKETAEQTAQSFQMLSMDPSLKAQAAAAGVSAAKGLLTKKAKLVRVTVKAGYRILLKDENQNL